MDTISLTKNELEIMEVMWEIKKPLSRAEIIELTPNRTWSTSSIHILLNKLLEKGAIKVDGFVRTNKNYGRTYSPLITQDEYIRSSIKQVTGSSFYKSKPSAVASIFSALIQDSDIDEALLCELEQMIEERKKQGEK